MEEITRKKGYICDMDGVIYHGNQLLDGAAAFVDWLKKEDKQFLFLTNSSERSPRELRQKLQRLGIDVEESHFYTSALATASFLSLQSPGCSAYVIGEPGLVNALYDAGITMNDVNPDYVVVGDTRNYNFENIQRAVRFIFKGAKLVGTNPDCTNPLETGMAPATGALVSPIEITTGKKAYFVGKPNPLMMRTGLKLLNCKSEDTAIIGDRMDTDIIAGIESEIDTVLVLSGVSDVHTPSLFPYRPKYILDTVGDIIQN
ncbi:HAD-IIA family hydrolase [Ethanoligenens harbinense]|uniref:HAD-superfamily hydrolase, subfamily IIA n=1 Tax=Ethanoligenens harbinense (strain DSM 18485 / JCM 12961 / CGMCC 1.5033 / YUAN-3) TaxID=663278 RepID=E6U4K4_ETHHY|nr:HAD-IIA family hydrolase [Ethanoligenens harbinense]ADU26632.1 HAD-superfamily hydrolase, subfamily IIA [Ethanoligenens harbinense YUAN-3]AVQ97373.1 TIGR01457 family HAD-type hydrolase [Ethanoligenens harbinense YUAN-3]AYF41160.1 TIGR01457 family HAD-type hydrolase [Ethanoligenens harbinense]QCN93625.1 HAD family hydrolase [Ethanoligenens harbinense]